MRVLSDKRSKYSVVSTKTPQKTNTFSNSVDFEGHLQKKNSFHPSPCQSEIFLFLHKSIFEQNPVIGYEVNSTLKLKIFFEDTGTFFPHKIHSFLLHKIFFSTYGLRFERRKEELPPFSYNSILDFFHSLFRKPYL